MKDSGAFLERKVAGLRRVKVNGMDFAKNLWGYQVTTLLSLGLKNLAVWTVKCIIIVNFNH